LNAQLKLGEKLLRLVASSFLSLVLLGKMTSKLIRGKIVGKNISVGAKYFDWGVTANIEIVEWDGKSIFCRAKVVASGAVYFSRIEHLEKEKLT
jgi:hypothetical protein